MTAPLVQRLRGCIGFNGTESEIIAEACARLDALEREREPWVKVSDRLPEAWQEVQLWDERRGYGQGCAIPHVSGELHWKFNGTSGNPKVTGINILYWQPIPGAYAVTNGAREISWKQAGCMCARRRKTGELGSPDDAIAWVQAYWRERQAEGATGQ